MLLVTLLMGIMEFGYAFFVQGTMAGAAREAARSYAIHQQTNPAVEAAKNAATITWTPDTLVAISGCVAAGGSDPQVTVTITRPYPGLTGFFGSFTLTATGTMRCSG